MRTFDIRDFSAVAGTKCTEAIQCAIDAACEAGGETVVIPRGEYVTGTVNLHGVQDVSVTNAYVAPFHGKQPVAYTENCQNVCC